MRRYPLASIPSGAFGTWFFTSVYPAFYLRDTAGYSRVPQCPANIPPHRKRNVSTPQEPRNDAARERCGYLVSRQVPPISRSPATILRDMGSSGGSGPARSRQHPARKFRHPRNREMTRLVRGRALDIPQYPANIPPISPTDVPRSRPPSGGGRDTAVDWEEGVVCHD